MREDLIANTKSYLEIINSARLGKYDYDFESVKIINTGYDPNMFLIKSKKDGKTYGGKRLKYKVDNYYNSAIEKTSACNEIYYLRSLDHPMIIRI